MKTVRESVLFTTSAATDWQSGGGDILITGLRPISKKDVVSIKQLKFKAEIPQVVKVATTSFTSASGVVSTGSLYVPTGGTKYTVAVFDPNRRSEGYQEYKKEYSYTTTASLATEGTTAALQREFINGQLITKINADTTNKATAATLAGGTGFTVTDRGGYYPYFGQTMTNLKFTNTVLPATNADGSGFTATNYFVSTVGQTSVGVGATLLTAKPVVNALFQNLVSGQIDPPILATDGTLATPVSGQNYDIFIINSVKRLPNPTITNAYTVVDRETVVYVDNGTGSSVTNLAGFVAFEKEALRAAFGLYDNDPIAIYDFFDNALIASATYPTTGLAVTTTDNVVMAAKSSQQKFDWFINPIGAHTIITPIVSTGGISPFMDVTSQEGLELSPPNLTQNPKQFVVGKTEASFYVRLNIGAGVAATDFKTLSIGFRKKAAYAVDQTAYEAASVATACIGVPLDTGVAPVFNIITGPGSAGALTNTSTVVTPAVSTSHDLLITVDINGLTKFYVNGVDKTTLLATAYSFTAGLNLMPFISFRHAVNAGAAPLVLQAAFIPSITWRG